MDPRQKIGVVETSILMTLFHQFSGVRVFPKSIGPADFEFYLKTILGNLHIMRRGEVEENEGYLQPISYIVPFCPGTGNVLVQTRAKDGGYDEDRLRGRLAIGHGGHFDEEDLLTVDPIIANHIREPKEELGFDPYVIGNNPFDLIGFIMDRSNPVGRVHFGLLSILKVPNQDFKRSGEASKFDWVPALDLDTYLHRGEDTQPENWTVLARLHLSAYFAGLLHVHTF